MAEPAGEYDIFLSHASPDKPWVETLKTRLEALGLRVWLDKDEIRAGDNWVIRLSDGLAISRYLVLVLSDHTADNRPWVTQEWTAFAAKHGPLGRPLPIKIDNGETRRSALPWKTDKAFGVAHMEFTKLHRESLAEGPGRADLFRHARTLGGCLFDMLFDEADSAMLEKMIGADRPRPVIQLRSGDPLLRALPWELLHHGDRFLLREGAIDLVRGTTDEVDGATLLKKPTERFRLVVILPRLCSFGQGREGRRLLRASARDYARDRRSAGRGQRPRQSGNHLCSFGRSHVRDQLEHFLTIWNHCEFSRSHKFGSRYGLVREASLDGKSSIDGLARTADIGC